MRNWKKHTILIAEDEYLNYLLLSETLSKTGVNIIWAKNGFEAVEKFKTNRIDLILMDIKMPGENGIEAAKEIKEINPKLPIVAQTAYAMVGEKEVILRSGIDEYLTKPIKMNNLYEVLDRYLTSE
jgi:CheY-like chemotaxis protein